MSPLEKGLREDCERIMPKMRLFIAPCGFPEDRLVIWDGEDIDGFLSCAKSAQSDFFYLHRIRTSSADEVPSDYADQICEVQLAFYYNDLFHAFKKEAGWLDEYLKAVEACEVEEVDHDCLPKAQELSSEQIDEIAGAFIAYLVDQDEAVDTESIYFVGRLGSFLNENYGFPVDIFCHQDFTQDNELERWVEIADNVLTHVAKKCIQYEEQLVEELYPLCVGWALKNCLKTVTQGETELFLESVDKKVSKRAKKAIWQKAKFALKTGEL